MNRYDDLASREIERLSRMSDPYRNDVWSMADRHRALSSASHMARLHRLDDLAHTRLTLGLGPIADHLRPIREAAGAASLYADKLNKTFEEARRIAAIPHNLQFSSALFDSAQRMADISNRVRLPQSFYEEAHRVAEFARGFQLPTALEAYRAPLDQLAAGMIRTNPALWDDRRYLDVFNQSSAFAKSIAESARFAQEHFEAARAISRAALPALESLGEYRRLFDAAGLILPRWPRPRLLSVADKRRRLRARLIESRESRHVRMAKSLVHRYETVLREIIDLVMAAQYGDDWAEHRLPLCGCSDLLGRWRNRGGEFSLQHADYAHYARIMVQPEHFETVFAVAFDNPGELERLVKRAGALRAASHHPQHFTAEDLRELRVVWRMLEHAMVMLSPDYVIDSDGDAI